MNAVYEFQHMFEMRRRDKVLESTASQTGVSTSNRKILGHTKNLELVPWEARVPRDNMVYYVSETQNLKHIDREIRE